MSPCPIDQVRSLIESGELAAGLQVGQAALPRLEGAARGQMLLQVAAACLSMGRSQDSLRAAVAAGDLFKELGDDAGACDAMLRIAGVLRAAGDHATALTTLEQAETMARRIGEPARIANVLRLLGVCCSVVGRHQHALSCLQEAHDLHQQHGQTFDRLNVRLSQLNAINRQAESHPPGSQQARDLTGPLIDRWQQLAEDCAAHGLTRLQAMARGNRAITLYQHGQPAVALAELQALLPLYRKLGMKPNEALTEVELGRCQEACGDNAQACGHYRRGIALLRDGGSLEDLVQALDGLSRVEEALGHVAEALAALRELRSVERRQSDDAARNAVSQRELRIELARLTSQWAQQATQDPLTGLGNRRAVERWLGDQLPRVEQGERATLMLMDLDHFKQVNDRFGHDTGDEVLRQVATLIRRHCRTGDLAARYGGEEFLLALSGVPRPEALEVAERLRMSIASHDWQRLRPGLVVTVSIGLTEAAEAANADGLLTLADQRLYQAKFSGRNRLVAA